MADYMEEYKPLFERAEKEELWFFCPYQDLWFSAEELKDLHQKNQFRWGVMNWILRSPKEKLSILEQRVEEAMRELEDFRKRMR